MQGFRRAAIHLALAALILRAFLPAGWMPNPHGAGQSALIICSMDGPVLDTDAKSPIGKDDPRAHESCPFAQAAQPSPANEFAVLAAPLLSEVAAPRQIVFDFTARDISRTRPASRAPPALI